MSAHGNMPVLLNFLYAEFLLTSMIGKERHCPWHADSRRPGLYTGPCAGYTNSHPLMKKEEKDDIRAITVWMLAHVHVHDVTAVSRCKP